MTRKRQLVVLAVLAAVLIFLILRPSARDGGGRGAGLGARRGAPAVGDSSLTALEVTPVRLADLENKPGQFSPGRDPFRFVAPKPKPAASRPKRARPRPRRAAAAAPPAATAQPAATPPRPRPPAIDFRYLGSFGPKDMRIAVFTDSSEIYNARAGEVLKEKFVVHQIGFETADIGFVGFPDEPPQRLEAGG